MSEPFTVDIKEISTVLLSKNADQKYTVLFSNIEQEKKNQLNSQLLAT
jgi:hypothetical protein